MRSASKEFKETIAKRTDFYAEADVVFSDGRELELGKTDFYLTGNSFTDAAGSSSFPLGVALEKQIEISLVNDKEQFSDYDFINAKFTIYCCLDLDNGTTEKLLIGTFTVVEPEAYGSIVTVTAVDDMYKGDIDYSTNLTYPLSAGEALRDSCSTCGVVLLDTTFMNDDYVISEMPDGITHRQLWGLCAMLAGGNARMDEYNRLRIISYDFSLFDRPGADGGIFDNGSPSYETGDDVYGGIFNPWDTGDVLDGGTFLEMDKYHVLWKTKNLTVATDDVVITGVQITVDDTTYRYGYEGYVLSITNQLIEGNPQEAIARIGALIVGAKFRPFTMDHIGYPLAEFGDICYVVDRKQNTYQSIITDVNFTWYGYTTLQCQADSPLRNSSKYYSALTEAIVQSRRETQKQISDYDLAMQALTSLITQSFGVFKTEEVLDDGSIIYYMHNKPTLEESSTVWRMAADVFSVSTDGGKTWNAGIDSSGNAVVNVLSAIGITFDWARGGTLTLGGVSNGNGRLRILNDSGAQVGYIDNTGVHFNEGTFSGTLQAAGGTFSGDLIAVGGTFSGDISAASGIFTGGIKTSNAEITGGLINIETASSQENVITLQYEVAYSRMGAGFMKTEDGTGAGQATGSFISYPTVEGANVYVTNYFQANGNAKVLGDFEATGVKARTVYTDDFGSVMLYAYETATPLFGDVGVGRTDSDGKCYIYFDAKFRETVTLWQEYSVFLQKEGPGDLWVSEKALDYFVVEGTAGLKFSWDVKARQAGYESDRMEHPKESPDEPYVDYENMMRSYADRLTIDYASAAEQLIAQERAKVMAW